jgi:hypothetical protein
MAETKPAGPPQGQLSRPLTNMEKALGLRLQDINKHPKEVKALERDPAIMAEIQRTDDMLKAVLERRGIMRLAKASDGDAFGLGSEVIDEKYRSDLHVPDVFNADSYCVVHPEAKLPWPFSEEGFEFRTGAVGTEMSFTFHKGDVAKTAGIVGEGPLGIGPTFGINKGDIGEPIPVKNLAILEQLWEQKVFQATIDAFIKADGPITSEQSSLETQLPEAKPQPAKPGIWGRLRGVLSQPQKVQREVK